MDDIRVITMALKTGWRWVEDGFYWCEEWKTENDTSGVTKEERTINMILESVNTVLEFLTFTKESPQDVEVKKLSHLTLKSG